MVRTRSEYKRDEETRDGPSYGAVLFFPFGVHW